MTNHKNTKHSFFSSSRLILGITMDGDDFEDEFDIDFVNSASNKVKAKWAKTSIDKDLRDVTNTFEDDNLESKKKKKSKGSLH